MTLPGLANSLWAFTMCAILLGLIGGAFLFAVEELIGRRALNDAAIIVWVRLRDRNASWLAVALRRWASLPYKQLAGSIASVFQLSTLTAEEQSTTKQPPPGASPPISMRPEVERGDLRAAFVLIGARLLEVEVPAVDIAKSFLAEHALDDLQAYLGIVWTRARYVFAGIVTLIVFAVMAKTHLVDPAAAYFPIRETPFGATPRLSDALTSFPLLWITAVLFAPLFRDALEAFSARQR